MDRSLFGRICLLLGVVYFLILTGYWLFDFVFGGIVFFNVFFLFLTLLTFYLSVHFKKLKRGKFSLTSFTFNIFGAMLVIVILLTNYIFLYGWRPIVVLVVLWISPQFILNTMVIFTLLIATFLFPASTIGLAQKVIYSPKIGDRKLVLLFNVLQFLSILCIFLFVVRIFLDLYVEYLFLGDIFILAIFCIIVWQYTLS